jgi:hypothetical protein
VSLGKTPEHWHFVYGIEQILEYAYRIFIFVRSRERSSIGRYS